MQEGNRARFGTTVLGRNACDMILTGIRNAKKGEPSLKVRCYCMAPVGSRKYGSFKYDVLGIVSGVKEARVVWDEHVRLRQIQDAGPANLTQPAGPDIVAL